MAEALPIGLFASWLAGGERGLSSECMVSTLTGVPVSRFGSTSDFPRDPSDLVRCEKLLRTVPLARPYLPTMATVSDTWAALVEHWDELVGLIEEEVPGAFGGAEGMAPRAYERMRELRGSS